MPAPFVKFYLEWMPELGLAGNEALVFTVIHGYTEWQGGYSGGTEPLERLTGLARSGVYRVLDKLIQRGYIALTSTKKGRFHSTYKSLLNRPTDGTVEEGNRPTDGTQPSYGRDSNRPTGGTLLDNNRYIDTPRNPPVGGSARRRRRNRALGIIGSGIDYADIADRNSREFYNEVLDEIRID